MIDAPPAPPAAVGSASLAPLCESGLRIVLRATAATTPATCRSRIALGTLQRTFHARLGRRTRSFAAPSGWTTHFAHGPQTGPRAWDSRTLVGNHEEQIYVDPAFSGDGDAPLRLSPFIRDATGLSILARPTPKRLLGRLWGYRYISGLITSQARFSQTYGYFEVRAKLPAGRGLWPAVWLLPKAGGWPPELDLLEQTGGETVFQTVHTGDAGHPTEADFSTTVRGAATGFHTYGVLWTPERLVWFVDRRQTSATPTPADMDRPMYLLINLAVGGDFPGPPDPSAHWPARLRIARVDAYRWPAQAATSPAAP